MRRIIRTLLLICAVLCAGRLCQIPCCAEDNDPQALFDSLAPDGIPLPEQAQSELERAGVDPSQPETMLSVTPEDFLAQLWETVRDEAAAPFRLLPALLMLTLAAAMLHSLSDAAGGKDMQPALSFLCTMLCAGTVITPVLAALQRTEETLRAGELFTAGFVPVFAGFLAAGGNPGTGASYQLFVMFLAGTVMAVTERILLPVLRMACALGITDAVAPELKLKGLVSGLRTAVTWTLGAIMTLFSALLTIRSFVASAADSLGTKTVKLLSSSLIPIVGSAVSDAYGTVQGSIALLRNGVGAAGILAIVWLTVPPLLSVGLLRIILILCRICAEMTDADSAAALLRNAESMLSAAFAMLVCYALMQIFSAAIALMLVSR